MSNKNLNKEKAKFATKQSREYRKLAGTLLRAESISKIRRYGVDGYKTLFIHNPEKSFSSYMNTFLYLRKMEESYLDIRDRYQNIDL